MEIRRSQNGEVEVGVTVSVSQSYSLVYVRVSATHPPGRPSVVSRGQRT